MLILLRPLHMVPSLYVCFVSHLVVCLPILNFWVCLIGPPIEAVPCIWLSSSPLECFLFPLCPFKNGRNQTMNGIQNFIILLSDHNAVEWSLSLLCPHIIPCKISLPLFILPFAMTVELWADVVMQLSRTRGKPCSWPAIVSLVSTLLCVTLRYVPLSASF